MTCQSNPRGPVVRSRDGRRQAAAGFTMVEIMVVVVIIGVLAALILPPIFGKVGKAKTSVATQQVAQIEAAIQMFYTDYERFPQTLDELVTGPGDIPEEKWSSPTLLAKHLKDPWGNAFVYKIPGDHSMFDLYSLGHDGQEGGEGEDADIVNW